MPIKKRKCKNCGKLFTPEFGRFNQKYCNDSCRLEGRKKTESERYEKNKEKRKAKFREYYHNKVKNNPEARKIYNERAKEYRENNIEKIKERQKDYYKKNRKKILAKKRNWWQNRGKEIDKSKKQGKNVSMLQRGRPRTPLSK